MPDKAPHHPPEPGKRRRCSSTAPPACNGYVRLINRNSGKFLDVYGSSTTDGTAIVQWMFSTASNQEWALRTSF
ncbi:RICIN domain-containing protein [Streptomyces sp. NPDC052020]|uniref:RICIN domain-containing protein n=1 Tax=Streptomyces sp. NPDC052020 TaxID=3155677 RepID=UPI003414584B